MVFLGRLRDEERKKKKKKMKGRQLRKTGKKRLTSASASASASASCDSDINVSNNIKFKRRNFPVLRDFPVGFEQQNNAWTQSKLLDCAAVIGRLLGKTDFVAELEECFVDPEMYDDVEIFGSEHKDVDVADESSNSN